jgi:hypothetical protein
MPLKLLSPVGRIVQGNPLFKSPVMDDVTKQQKIGKDGQPSFNWWITVAFDKRDPDTWPMICAIKQEAASAYPQLFPQGWNPNAQNEGCVRPDFAFKVVDGDGTDLNGKPHSNKEGWGGHYIVKISTYAGTMKCYDGLQNNLPITDMEQIHTGKYVRVSLDIKGNGWTGQGNSKPGLFVNPDGVQLVGHGAKISGGPDADTMFAQPVSGYIPPGMSTTAPVAAISMPGHQPAPQQAMQMPQMTPAPQAQPQMQMQAPQPSAAPVYTMTPAAHGYTREQWLANGQTDESLIAAGYMTVSTPAPAPVMVAPQPQMQMPAPMGQQPQMQAPQQPAMVAPQAAPQPQMQMAVPNPAFTQSAIAPTYTMTPAAQGYTREQWLANGQTDASLIAAGMMLVA